MLIINPYDRYAPDNSPSSDNAPSRSRISFSRKAAPVVSITPTSAISTGQENRSPTNSVPFPSSTPQIPSNEPSRDAIYIPCPDALFPVPKHPESSPSTHSHRRQRSNSGLTSIQHGSPRPLAPLNPESRANIGCFDLGKSTPVLSISSSGTVSRVVGHDHLRKSLATARQRRLQQLDRKRNASIVTKKQTKKASMDAKFLISLHHSITWHIETRSDQKGSRELDIQDGLLAQRIFQHLTQKGQFSPSASGSENAKETLMYPVPVPFPASDSPAQAPSVPSPAPIPGPGIMTMPQIVAALHLKYRDRSTRPPRPRNPVARKPSASRRSPLSQLC